MVCDRCKMVVTTELKKYDLHPLSVDLGEVTLKESKISATLLFEISTALFAAGFELIDNRKSRMIERIKNVVVTMVHYSDERPKQKYSEFIAHELHYDYPYLSKLFSEIEGITIEQYIIQQKVEKIKEYLVYDELNLSQVADRMGYSSVAHLSAQFKKITGLPPSHFKNIGIHQRKPLDRIGGQ